MRTLAIGAALLLLEAATGPLRQSSSTPSEQLDRKDLVRMFEEDQADRAGNAIDWSVVQPRDESRRAKVMDLFASGDLKTGGDFYRAAMILQHGSKPEDFLLAHEFCVAAMALGKTDDATRWLAAASEDRFLMNLNRPQRFGTQYRSEGAEPMHLYVVDELMTDQLRRIMAAPSLAEAQAREADFRKK
jgi:hypothetical protein